MRTLGKLKLNQLNREELNLREMEYLRGGATSESCMCACVDLLCMEDNSAANSEVGTGESGCTCGCNNSSSMSENSMANSDTGTGECVCGCNNSASMSDNSSANHSL